MSSDPGKDRPLGQPRTARQAAPTCSPPCGHSASNSPSHGSGSRQSGRGPHTPGSSRGTCGRGSAGGRRSCTGWAAASGTPGKSRKKHQESKSLRSHGGCGLTARQPWRSGFPRTGSHHHVFFHPSQEMWHPQASFQVLIHPSKLCLSPYSSETELTLCFQTSVLLLGRGVFLPSG